MGVESKRMPGGWQWLPWVLLVAPSLYHFYAVNFLLEPVALGDAFRYLWTIPINWYFFTGSSLTLRVLYWLSGNNLHVIANLHVLVFLITQFVLFLTLRQRSPAVNLALALVIVLFFESPWTRGWQYMAAPEPIFTCLMLIFTCAVVSARRSNRVWLPIAVGVLFIFSRNLAPYIALTLCAGLSILYLRDKRPMMILKVALPISLVALGSMTITQRYDTSVELNLTNNMYQRVFPHADRTQFFNERYGMPVGTFVHTCVDPGGVNAPCFDHETIYSGNVLTRNYQVTLDEYGFLDWVRLYGASAWTDFLLFQNTGETYREYASAHARLFANLPRFGAPNAWHEIEPMRGVVAFWDRLGLSQVGILVIILLAGALVSVVRRDLPVVDLGVALLLVSIPATFIGYYGDGIDSGRHMFPGMLVLYLALTVLSVSLALALWGLARWCVGGVSAGRSPAAH